MSPVTWLQLPFMRLHQWLFEVTDGRVGPRLIGVPTLLLRTVGRRTGEPRTAALVYLDDGGTYCVVASNGGQDRPPGWFFNLQSEAGEVQVGRRRLPVRAEVIGPGHPDRERSWEALNAINRGRYDGYQQRTDRPIAIVRLIPIETPSAA
jgi:F420H(2)-dependent quinone reductase